jgi:hypothetical protein
VAPSEKNGKIIVPILIRSSVSLSKTQSDDVVKSMKRRISVIPAKAGIQLFPILKNSLDSGFHRSDDYLEDHQNSFLLIFGGPKRGIKKPSRGYSSGGLKRA